MGDQISWVKGQPRRYDFDIRLDGNKVAVTVNSVTFATGGSSTNRLFLGYRSKPEMQGTYLNAVVSGLTIIESP